MWNSSWWHQVPLSKILLAPFTFFTPGRQKNPPGISPPIPEGSLPLCPSSTGWHRLSSVFFHPGWCPASSENFLLTEFHLYIRGDLWLLLHSLLAAPALVSPSAAPSAWPWMAREASQQAPSLFSCFPAKETSACQTVRQHTTEILPDIADFLPFFMSRAKEVGDRFPMGVGVSAEHC